MVKTAIALAERVMDGMTFQKPVGPGFVLAGSVDPPETAVSGWWMISSEPNLEEHLLAIGLIGPEDDLEGSGSTALEAAKGNTGSLGHSGCLCWKH